MMFIFHKKQNAKIRIIRDMAKRKVQQPGEHLFFFSRPYLSDYNPTGQNHLSSVASPHPNSYQKKGGLREE